MLLSLHLFCRHSLPCRDHVSSRLVHANWKGYSLACYFALKLKSKALKACLVLHACYLCLLGLDGSRLRVSLPYIYCVDSCCAGGVPETSKFNGVRSKSGHVKEKVLLKKELILLLIRSATVRHLSLSVSVVNMMMFERWSVAFVFMGLLCDALATENFVGIAPALSCPSPCHCRRQTNPESGKTQFVVSCSGLGLTDVPTFDAATAPHVHSLDLSNNNIRDLGTSDVFEHLTSLQVLDLGSTPIDCSCSNSIAILHTIAREEPGRQVSVKCLLGGLVRDLTDLPLEDLGCSSLSWHQKSASPMVVEAGVDVTLKCHAEGTPSPVVSWTQHGSPVTPGPTRALGHHGRLRLFNVQPSDTGTFVCHVTNYISILEAEIHVAVPSAGMADGEAPHESAGVNSNVVTVDRIAGGVDALKNQLRAAFDRITELEMQLTSIGEDTVSPTIPMTSDFTASQEARIEQLIQASILHHLRPVQAQVNKLVAGQRRLQSMAGSDLQVSEHMESESNPATAGQSSASDVERRLATVESELEMVKSADLTSRQRTTVSTFISSQTIGRFASLTRNINSVKRDVATLKASPGGTQDNSALVQRVSSVEAKCENASAQVAVLASSGLSEQQQMDVDRSIIADLQPITTSLADLRKDLGKNIEQNQASFLSLITDATSRSQDLDSLEAKITQLEAAVNSNTGTRPGDTSSTNTALQQQVTGLASRVEALTRADLNAQERNTVSVLVTSSTESRFASLTREFRRLKSAVDNLNDSPGSPSENSELTGRLDSLEAKCANFTLQIAQLFRLADGGPRSDTNDGKLVEDVQAIRTRISSIEATTRSNRGQLGALGLVLGRLGGNILTSTSSIQEVNSTLTSKFAILKEENELLQLLLSDLNISGLRAALEQSQRELPRKVNETLQPLLTLIREASGPVGQGPSTVDTITAPALAAVQASVQALTATVGAVQNSVDRQVADLTARIDAFSNEGTALSGSEETRVRELISEGISDLSDDLVIVNMSAASALRQVSTAASDLRRVQRSQTSLRNLVLATLQPLTQRVSVLERMSTSTGGSDTMSTVKSEQITMLQEELRALTTQVMSRSRSVDDSITELLSGVSSLTSQGQDLSEGQRRSATALVTSQLSPLVTGLQAVQMTLNLSSIKVEEVTGEVKSLQERLSDLETAVTSLEDQSQNAVSPSRFSALQNALSGLRGSLTSVTSRISSLEQSQRQQPPTGTTPAEGPGSSDVDSRALTALQSQVRVLGLQLTSLFGNLGGQVATVRSRQENITTQLLSHSQLIRNVRGQHATDKREIDGRLNQFQVRLNEVNTNGPAPVDSRLSSLERSRTVLEQSRTQLERADRQKDTRITAVKSQADRLQQLVDAVRRTYDREHDTIKRRLDAVERGVSSAARLPSLERRLNTYSETSQTVQSRLEELESSLEELSQEVSHQQENSLDESAVTALIQANSGTSLGVLGQLTRFTQTSRREINQLKSRISSIQASGGDGLPAELQKQVNTSIAEAVEVIRTDSEGRGEVVQQELENFYELIESNNGNQLRKLREELRNAMDTLRVEQQTALAVFSDPSKCTGVTKLDTQSWAQVSIDEMESGSLLSYDYFQAGEAENATLEVELTTVVTLDSNAVLSLSIGGQPCQPMVSGMQTSIRRNGPVGISLRGVCRVQSPTGIHQLSLDINSANSAVSGSLENAQLLVKEYC